MLERLLPAGFGKRSKWQFASLWTIGSAAGASLGLSVVYMEADANTFADRTTGLPFSKELSVDTSKGPAAQRLVGTGCRYKYTWVQVYAVGLYVSPSTPTLLGSDDEVLNSVLNSNAPATLVLKLNRELDVNVMVEALEDAIRTRVNKNATDKQRANAAVDSFRELLFGGGLKSIPKGGSFVFTREHGRLWVTVQGKVLGCIVDADVTLALFDTYLGANPISPEAKANFAKGLKGAN